MEVSNQHLTDDGFKATLKLSKAELSQIKLGYCTPSAGAAKEHTLPLKLQAIAAAGFQSVEMGFPDLVKHAEQMLGDSFGGESDFDSLVQVAESMHTKCQELGLYVATLMPFGPYGGYTTDEERQDALDRAEGWFRIIKALGNPMLQCGSSDEATSSSNIEQHIKDLQTLGDRAAKKGIKIAYEQWCWAKVFNTWQHSYDIVKRVDRPNVGVCLDTFQIAGIDFADPTTASGLNEHATPNPAGHLEASIAQLASEVDPDKIFYLQISSATRMVPPLGPAHPDWQDDSPARFQWSNQFRPMPFSPERGSYLPVMPVLQAVLQTGFRGLLSCETFDMEKMQESGEKVPAELTSRAYIILKQHMLSAFEQ